MPAVSHWWEQIGGPPPRRPGLTGPREADVCIVGAGYTGLWTAVALLQARPSLEVVVLEREYAGFGASGRNGGWVVGALTGSRARWIARAGNARALALVRAAQATVDEVGRFVADEGIECDFVKGGSLQSHSRNRSSRASARSSTRIAHSGWARTTLRCSTPTRRGSACASPARSARASRRTAPACSRRSSSADSPNPWSDEARRSTRELPSRRSSPTSRGRPAATFV